MDTVSYRRRVNAILESVLELNPSERDDYLEKACGGDAHLHSGVASLLVSFEEAGTFLENPVRSDLDELAEEQIPESIGPYKILSKIGQGGMGVVYLGERHDGQYHKKISIKMLKRGMDTDHILRRFLHERQILANLDHPNIARLYDGGVTADGRPYFVMEYIEGDPIDVYCEKRALDLNERLRLFMQVCTAVHYAHSNLVVHRDIKPGNILVTHDGTPKLLDFGIAKLLHPEPGSQITQTAAGAWLMTPDYASPEQVRGETVTTATDVYSLGVLLFRLMTGKAPYSQEEPGYQAYQRMVCEEEPLKPSVAISRTQAHVLKRSSRDLAGDLDTITLKALRKEPERRYISAAQLSEDIGRHLDFLPVLARRETASYIIWKFIRRNKLLVIGATSFCLLLALAPISYTLARSQEQKETAREWRRAERVTRFLVDAFEMADPYQLRQEDLTVREVLDRAASNIQDDLTEEPLTRASLLNTMGQVYLNIHVYDVARPMLELAYSLRKEHLPENSPDLAASHFYLGKLTFLEGNYDEAMAPMLDSLSMRETGNREELVDSLNGIAILYNRKGRFEDAVHSSCRALDILNQLPEPNHILLGQVYDTIGQNYQSLGLYTESLLFADASVEHHRRMYGRKHPLLINSLTNLSVTLIDIGQFDRGERVILEALLICEQVFDIDHQLHGDVLNNLGALFLTRGKYDQAEETLRRGIRIIEGALGEDNVRLAGPMSNLGKTLSNQGRSLEAEAVLKKVLQLRKLHLGEIHASVGITTHDLASVYRDLDRSGEAIPLFLEAIRIFKQTVGSRHHYVAASLYQLGLSEYTNKNWNEARGYFEESFSIVEEQLGAEHPYAAFSMLYLARINKNKGDLQEALRLSTKVLGILETSLTANNPRLIASQKFHQELLDELSNQ